MTSIPPLSKGKNLVQNATRLWKLQQQHILDTDAEPGFDDIAKIASALCGTPVAMVSLVDANRQWFKAKVGLDVSETPIEHAICVHALGSDGLVEIADLSRDERTSENALVTGEPRIRFYAGAPLNTPDGHSIGTVCVIDLEPRPEGLSDLQREGLEALGRQAMAMIEMRRLLIEQELASTRERRSVAQEIENVTRANAEQSVASRRAARQIEAQEAGRIGTFEIDTGSDIVRVSPEFCRLYGLEPAESYPADVIIANIHEEDRHLASGQESRDNALAVRDVDYRIVRPSDGAVRWISRRASFNFGADGKPLRMLGTVHDVTDRRFAHDRMRFLLELGDKLHVAETVEDAAGAAAESLRNALMVMRAGYASFDLAGGRVKVEQDATLDGATSVKGWRPTFEYPETLAKMREGKPIAISDIRALPWMKKEVAGYEAVGAIAQLWIPVSVHGVLVGALFAQHDKPRNWSLEEREFAESVAYRTYMAIAKLQAEADQRMLNQELGHRLKNMLAMIMALATQSLKRVTEQGAVENFRKRLLALGSAHEDLLQRNWSGGSVVSILGGVLDRIVPHERVVLSGPDIVLGPRASLSLSLMAHELGTNALKYGALSVDSGTVKIKWWTEGGGETEKIFLRWSEEGGPPVVAPESSGFGSQLIEMGLMGTGDARVEFNGEGLVAEFTAPLQLARRA